MAKPTNTKDATKEVLDTVGEEPGENKAALAVPHRNGGIMTSDELTKQAQALAQADPKAQLRALQDAFGLDDADVEVIAAGKLPFWPAFAGAILMGTIQSRREIRTIYSTEENPVVGIYTVTVQERSCLAGTLDGEIFELNPGDQITLLERQVLKELQTRVGQKVAILCVGKMTPKNGFPYWDYKIIGRKRDAAQVAAAAQLAMVDIQRRQLAERNASE